MVLWCYMTHPLAMRASSQGLGAPSMVKRAQLQTSCCVILMTMKPPLIAPPAAFMRWSLLPANLSFPSGAHWLLASCCLRPLQQCCR